MKKFFIDKNYLKVCIYAFFLVVALIIFEKIIGNLSSFTNGIRSFFRFASNVLTPFFYGFFIAYLANPLIRFFDKLLIKIPVMKSRKVNRIISVLLTFVMVVLLLVFIIRYITPEIITSFKNLIDNTRYYISLLDSAGAVSIKNQTFGEFANSVKSSLDSFFDTLNQTFYTSFNSADLIKMVIDGLNKLIASLPTIAVTVFTGTVSFASSLFSMLIGLFIAFYMLVGKEHYASWAEKTVYAMMKKNNAKRFIDSVKSSNKVFEGFVVGKTLDSLIIGVIFLIVATIFKLPYPLLLSVIVGVTNMIPFIGPFIGAVPSILIVFISSFGSINESSAFSIYPTLITAVSILVIQQIDGNIIGPKILGDSTGLRPLEVIFAITLGGALFGILGMFLGVPVFAVIKIMLGAFVRRRYDERIEIEKKETVDESSQPR